MIFDSINHVAIIVSNLEQSLVFYKDILQLQETSRIDRSDRQSTIVYLDAKDVIIELFSFPNPPDRLSYPEATGLRHLAFSTFNFDQIVNQLKEQGIESEPVRIDQRTGKKMTFIFDPDGLPIEISEI